MHYYQANHVRLTSSTSLCHDVACAGVWYPLEMHIVHTVSNKTLPATCPNGCYTVTGIMLALGEENKALSTIFNNMPTREGVSGGSSGDHSVGL